MVIPCRPRQIHRIIPNSLSSIQVLQIPLPFHLLFWCYRFMDSHCASLYLWKCYPTPLQGMKGRVEREKEISLANYFYEYKQSNSNGQCSVPIKKKIFTNSLFNGEQTDVNFIKTYDVYSLIYLWGAQNFPGAMLITGIKCTTIGRNRQWIIQINPCAWKKKALGSLRDTTIKVR